MIKIRALFNLDAHSSISLQIGCLWRIADSQAKSAIRHRQAQSIGEIARREHGSPRALTPTIPV